MIDKAPLIGSDNQVVCFTSFTFSYISRARILAWSVKRLHPDWLMVAVITDEPPPEACFDKQREPFDEVLWGQELPIAENMSAWMFMHDIVEACTAVKGPALKQLLHCGAAKVIYLDPDTVVMNSMQPVIDLLDDNSIILTPHQLTPDGEPWAVQDNEIGSLKHGIYNLGFVAVANRSEGRRFAEWWSDRLTDFCYDDVVRGLFTDQRWCDHVPVFFDEVFILKDPGYNVASWNLSTRRVEFDADGCLRSNGKTLRFYHVTKFGEVGEAMTARYAGQSVAVYELWAWYARKLKEFDRNDAPEGWWQFGCYSSREPIPKVHRVVYRSRLDLQAAFPNPFGSNDQADAGLEEWFAANGATAE